MHDGVMARLELRADLQRALSAGEFELFFQPVVRLEDSSVLGVEALLRWRHPERGTREPRRLHPVRRGDRADRAHRPLGPARGLPPGGDAAGRNRVRPAADDERQPVRQAAAAQRCGRGRGGRAARVRARPRAADGRDHRVRDDERQRPGNRAAAGAPAARRAPGDGRLRDGLLVAQLPQPLPGRRPEDGPLVPACRGDARVVRAGQRGDRDRGDAAAGHRRRRDRARRAVDHIARPRVRARSGLPVRPANAHRRDPRGVAYVGAIGHRATTAAERELPAADAT